MGMMGEFKDFVSRGNVLDLAVGVIIGAAFGKIVTSLTEDIQSYMEREVLPHAPDAWVDKDKTRKGYEVPFTRTFYRYVAPRPLEEIDADLRRLSAEIQDMLREIAA